MSTTNIIGNEDGIALWNIMSSTDDELEKEYFSRINSAAVKFHKVWFTDIVTQRETKKNQTVWQITWDTNKSVWEITKFHVPSGAKDATDRIADYRFPPDQVIELSAADIVER